MKLRLAVALACSACATAPAQRPLLVMNVRELPKSVPPGCQSLPPPWQSCADAQPAALGEAQRCSGIADDVAFGLALAQRGLRLAQVPSFDTGIEGEPGQVVERPDGAWLLGFDDQVPTWDAQDRLVLVRRVSRASTTSTYVLCECPRIPGMQRPRGKKMHRVQSAAAYGGMVEVAYEAPHVEVKWQPPQPERCPHPQ